MRMTKRVLAVAIGLVGLAFCLTATPAPAAQEYAEVELTYNAADKTCSASPDPVKIFWNKKPKKVKWISAGGTDLYWDVVWKGGGKDYFRGNFDIKCGKDTKKSTLPSGKDKNNAQWGYTIAVYACSGNQRSGDKLCEVDPMVDWEP